MLVYLGFVLTYTIIHDQIQSVRFIRQLPSISCVRDTRNIRKKILKMSTFQKIPRASTQVLPEVLRILETKPRILRLRFEDFGNVDI
jgi:hypothetical protein